MIYCSLIALLLVFFFFNDTATTEIYTLSLHDALPILNAGNMSGPGLDTRSGSQETPPAWRGDVDRKSTRLNSSHSQISYAVFCLKKKKEHPASRAGTRFSHAATRSFRLPHTSRPCSQS